MGRHLERNDSVIEFQKYHSGCLSGILHSILDHHHRSNFKRILPRRKQGRGKHPICCKNPKTHSLEHGTPDVQGYLNVDAVPQLVDEENMEANVINQSSSKAQMKALIAKEMSGRLGLHKVELSHHQGSSMQGRSGLKAGWTSPIIILQRTSDADSTGWHAQSQLSSPQQASLSEKIDESAMCQPDALRLNRQTLGSKFKESVDILEIFQVNKKLFLEILHDPEVQGVNRVHFQHNSTPKLKLNRSGSFPAAEPSRMRSLRPSTLEHKKTETWSFPTAENSPSAIQSTKALVSNSAEDTCLKSDDIREGETRVAAINLELPEGLSRNGRYSSVMSYITDLKKKIKHTLGHSKKVSERTIIDGLVIGVSSELKSVEDDRAQPERSLERSGDLDKDGVRLVRRTSSLNESMDKYTQLIESSFSREAPPKVQYRSRSLKLTSDDRNLSRGSSMKTFRRRLSLPDDIDSFLPFPYETLGDDLKSQMPLGPAANSHTNIASEVFNNLEAECNGIDASSDQFQPTKCEEETVVGETDNVSGGLSTNVEDRATEGVELHQEALGTCQDEQPASSVEDDEDRSPVSVLDTHFRENVGRSTESSKGQCLEPSSTSAGQLDRTTKPSSTGLSADAAAAAPETQDDPDWTYVRDLLYVSGFLEQDCLATWYSLDQPLSPKLYEELEAFLHHPDQLSHYDDNHHRLLFDLVNETLLDVFETKLAYFPMQLSLAQRNARPVPKGSQVLVEVWKRMSWFRSYGSWKDRSLNDITARDFEKGDGWMNLRFDAEDVALDLEDVILDELLDELIFE